MPYVKRNELNEITGLFARKQDFADEFLPNDNAEVKKYLNPPKTKSEIQSEIDSAIQQSLDDFARTRKYEGMDRLATYVTSTNAQFSAEAARGIRLRDDTWMAAGVILNDVLDGSRPVPQSYDDIKAELPELTWGDL